MQLLGEVEYYNRQCRVTRDFGLNRKWEDVLGKPFFPSSSVLLVNYNFWFSWTPQWFPSVNIIKLSWWDLEWCILIRQQIQILQCRTPRNGVKSRFAKYVFKLWYFFYNTIIFLQSKGILFFHNPLSYVSPSVRYLLNMLPLTPLSNCSVGFPFLLLPSKFQGIIISSILCHLLPLILLFHLLQ